MNTDLTVGKPWKVLIKYILPLLGSAVFQQLYTLADTIIAGKFSGSETALTAIGASNAIVNILMAIALGANAGCAVLCARYFGAKENGKVKTAVYSALIAFTVFSAVLLGVGLASCRPLLEAMGTPSAALEESVVYLNIYYLGVPFLVLYNLGTGIFPPWATAARRSCSSSRPPSRTSCSIISWCSRGALRAWRGRPS